MARKLKDKIKIAVLSTLCGVPLNLLRISWRLQGKTVHPDAERLLAEGKPVIFALWHGRMYCLLRAVDPERINILVSPSNDGEFIVRTVNILGFRHMIRGSHKRGGRSAIMAMHRSLKEDGRSVVFTVDGPRGPRYKVKPGIIKLASQTGAPILPLGSGTRRLFHKFDKSWDHYHVPSFFTRLHLSYGEPLYVPPNLEDEAELEACRLTLEERLMAINLAEDALYGHGEKRL